MRPARAAAVAPAAAVQPLLLLVVLLMLQLGRPVATASAADRQGQASRGPRIAVAQELPPQFAPKKHKI